MGIFDTLQHNVKAFIHSVTTDDHYASYDSPYKHNTINSSSTRLNELNRLAQNNSSTSLNSPSVSYRPGMRSSANSNPNVDVQLQDYVNGQPPLPTIDSIWEKLDEWYENEYPELGDNLNYGATSADLNEMENDLSCSLPLDVRQSYQFHDGQIRGGKPSGAIMGLTLLDIEGIVEEYSIWLRVSKKVEKQQFLQQSNFQSQSQSSSRAQLQGNNIQSANLTTNQKCYPQGSVQPVYSHQGWVPLVKDWAGNNIAVDLAPGPTGRWGQIILFGRDFDTKFVVANSWTEFLYNLLQDFEEGRYIVDEIDEDLMYNDKKGNYTNYIEILKRKAMAKYGVYERKEKLLPKVPPQSQQHQKLEKQSAKPIFVEETLLPKETLIDEVKDSTKEKELEKEIDNKKLTKDAKSEEKDLLLVGESQLETASIETIKPLPTKSAAAAKLEETVEKEAAAKEEEKEEPILETEIKETDDTVPNTAKADSAEQVAQVAEELKEIEL